MAKNAVIYYASIQFYSTTMVTRRNDYTLSAFRFGLEELLVLVDICQFIVRIETQCLSSGWSTLIKVRLLGQRCHTSTMSTCTVLVIPRSIVDGDAVIPQSTGSGSPSETELDVDVLMPCQQSCTKTILRSNMILTRS
jgi:hypothetical protein